MPPRTTVQTNLNPLLKAFAPNDPLRERVLHVLESLPEEVIEDFLADPPLHIHTLEKQPGKSKHHKTVDASTGNLSPNSQAFLQLPGKDGRCSRCVTLKRKLETAALPFCFYVIAHEFAHAHLHNGCWGEISDREEAADALAKTWGFSKPKHKNWYSIL